MKIDSIRHFSYALFHPFSKKVNTSTTARVGIAVLSALLIIPMAYAGASFLIGRISKKNPKNLTQADLKTKTVAQSHNPAKKPTSTKTQAGQSHSNPQPVLGHVERVAAALRSRNADSEMASLKYQMRIDDVLDGLDQFTPYDYDTKQTCCFEYSRIAEDPRFSNTLSHVTRCLNGLMRLKEFLGPLIFSYFAKISEGSVLTATDHAAFQAQFAHCFQQLDLGNQDYMLFRMMGLTSIAQKAKSFELRKWAIHEMVKLKDLPDTGFDYDNVLYFLLDRLGNLALYKYNSYCASWVPECEEIRNLILPLVCNLFQHLMARDDVRKVTKLNIQHAFLRHLRVHVRESYPICLVEPLDGYVKVLMAELEKLKDHPDVKVEIQFFIDDMKNHPSLKS